MEHGPYKVAAMRSSELAVALREARHAAGLTLRALAGRAGTSHSTLLAYEKGAKMPSISTFLRVLEACDFAVDLSLRRRVRRRQTLMRGEELEQVLMLAEAFPNRYEENRTPLEFPKFPSPAA